MCGRFAFFSAHEAIARLFGVPGAPQVEARYNIAPTQYVPVVRTDSADVRRLAMLYWGLVPRWAKDRSYGSRMINARAETIADKPAYREAFRRRRCLVLADGYYEWQVTPSGKQPWFIRLASGEPFAMAGLWESWIERPGAEPLESCTIVTTAAPPALADLHERMPVILRPEHIGAWLAPSNSDPARIAPLLEPVEQAALTAARVSRRVNSSRNDGPGLIEPELSGSGNPP